MDYSIKTEWKTDSNQDIVKHSKTGFYHNVTEYNNGTLKYVISGTLRNNRNSSIDCSLLEVKLFDKNNKKLYTTENLTEIQFIQRYLPKGYKNNFYMELNKEDFNESFEEISSFEFYYLQTE